MGIHVHVCGIGCLSLPFQFHFPEEGAAVVAEGVQEVCWELEGGAEHDDHVGESHLVD